MAECRCGLMPVWWGCNRKFHRLCGHDNPRILYSIWLRHQTATADYQPVDMSGTVVVRSPRASQIHPAFNHLSPKPLSRFGSFEEVSFGGTVVLRTQQDEPDTSQGSKSRLGMQEKTSIAPPEDSAVNLAELPSFSTNFDEIVMRYEFAHNNLVSETFGPSHPFRKGPCHLHLSPETPLAPFILSLAHDFPPYARLASATLAMDGECPTETLPGLPEYEQASCVIPTSSSSPPLGLPTHNWGPYVIPTPPENLPPFDSLTQSPLMKPLIDPKHDALHLMLLGMSASYQDVLLRMVTKIDSLTMARHFEGPIASKQPPICPAHGETPPIICMSCCPTIASNFYYPAVHGAGIVTINPFLLAIIPSQRWRVRPPLFTFNKAKAALQAAVKKGSSRPVVAKSSRDHSESFDVQKASSKSRHSDGDGIAQASAAAASPTLSSLIIPSLKEAAGDRADVSRSRAAIEVLTDLELQKPGVSEALMCRLLQRLGSSKEASMKNLQDLAGRIFSKHSDAVQDPSEGRTKPNMLPTDNSSVSPLARWQSHAEHDLDAF
ncbi:hypothetical protein KSP40_PGU013101 [Platanthera guangdongensis]|uniref:Uncharacterized protein n=1 Tax=Platanthera guangdongensis TaxID=2320717 RepID=A0ABR2MYN1_9ASPA